MTLTTKSTPTHYELPPAEKELQAAFDKSIASGMETWEAELIHGKRIEAARIGHGDNLTAIYDDEYETLTITDGEFSHRLYVGDYFHSWDSENDRPRRRPMHYGLKETKDFIEEFERIRGKRLNRKIQAIKTAREATYVAPKQIKFTATVTVTPEQRKEYERMFNNVLGLRYEIEEV